MHKKSIALVLAVVMIIGVLAAGAAVYFFPGRIEVSYDPTEPTLKTESSAWSSSDEIETDDSDTKQLMLIDFEGTVTVGTALVNLEDHPENHLEFEVTLDTHSEDLDQYDLTAISQLYLDGVVYPVETIQWRVTSGEGHHLKGRLTMLGRELDTRIFDVRESIELEMAGLGGVDVRQFRWELTELLSAREGGNLDS